MSYELFGNVSYVSQTKISEFVEHLKRGQLMGTKCEKCQAVFFPPRADCPKCLAEKMEWVEVSGEATLITFTEVNFAPTGFEAPYILALGRLIGGQQVFARMGKDVSFDQLKVGMKLKLVPAQIGEERVSYEFHLL